MHTDYGTPENASLFSGMRRAVSDDRIRAVLRAAIVLMCVVSVVWLTYQSWRYFAVPKQLGSQRIGVGAIDLRNRFLETRAWFRGENVYAIYPDAVYPPASYAMLGIAFNWWRLKIVKLLWYGLSLASVGFLSRQLIRQSLAQSRVERVFVGLMPFAFYATGAAVGNGQLVVFVLPLVLSAVLLLTRPALSTWDTWRGALLMLFALVQPTIAAPFFWLVMFVVPRMKPAVLVVTMYLGLTALAVNFQIGATVPAKPVRKTRAPAVARAPAPKPKPAAVTAPGAIPPPDASQTDGSARILNTWSARATHGAYRGSLKGGYASVHNLLATLGLAKWNWPVSLAILLGLGAWTFRHRRADLWLLLAVTAIVARVWTYHSWYDDLLLLLPLIALARMIKLPRYSHQTKTVAAGLFFWIWLFLLAPGVLYTAWLPGILVDIQVTGWIAGLVFLAYQIHRERRLPCDTGVKTAVA